MLYAVIGVVVIAFNGCWTGTVRIVKVDMPPSATVRPSITTSERAPKPHAQRSRAVTFGERYSLGIKMAYKMGVC